jgi:hypothetical protein
VDELADCDYHLRLRTSGLACVRGYESGGREIFCAERVYKENLCEHHYARKQQETLEALPSPSRGADTGEGPGGPFAILKPQIGK